MQKPIIVWFRVDLRLADNPALYHAAATGAPIIPLYIFDEESTGIRPFGAAYKWWLHHSLKVLQSDLAETGSSLLLKKGSAKAVLQALVETCDVGGIYWNRRYGKAERDIDSDIKQFFSELKLDVKSFNGSLLIEPWQVEKDSGGYYQVFTPFWRRAQEIMQARELFAAPDRLKAANVKSKSDNLLDWSFEPTQPNWAEGLAQNWTPGEKGAQQRLEAFLVDGLNGYAEKRDRPDTDNTSRLSPYLAHGNISPMQIWHATKRLEQTGSESSAKDRTKFLAEVGWREFSYNLLYFNPDLASKNYKPKFDDFPWVTDDNALSAWQKGKTGYPIVDAGMRQLWQTGWMHNRVRMIVASFLIKDLMLHWKQGEDWFWDTLVDADPASNAASWQWVAGSGADAAPYFRIFNPTTQGQKHDPKGDYVRKFVPELQKLNDEAVHDPAIISPAKLKSAGIVLGKTYPAPIVDHKKARDSALAAFQSLKQDS